MKNYTQIRGGEKIRFSETLVVDIQKVQKEGTRRVFYRPLVDGKKISNTLWTRLYDARKVARSYAAKVA